jgi:hypothetical protein
MSTLRGINIDLEQRLPGVCEDLLHSHWKRHLRQR